MPYRFLTSIQHHFNKLNIKPFLEVSKCQVLWPSRWIIDRDFLDRGDRGQPLPGVADQADTLGRRVDDGHSFAAGYFDEFSGWLARADSYYEVHLLLSLLERENASSDEALSEAMSLLASNDSLVVRRSYRYLKSQELNHSQQKKLEVFEQQHPDRW